MFLEEFVFALSVFLARLTRVELTIMRHRLDFQPRITCLRHAVARPFDHFLCINIPQKQRSTFHLTFSNDEVTQAGS